MSRPYRRLITPTTPPSQWPGSMRPGDVAILLDVSTRTVARMCERGDLLRVPGTRLLRIRRSSVVRALEGGR